MVSGGIGIVQFLAVIPAIIYIDTLGVSYASFSAFLRNVQLYRASFRKEAAPQRRQHINDFVTPLDCFPCTALPPPPSLLHTS